MGKYIERVTALQTLQQERWRHTDHTLSEKELDELIYDFREPITEMLESLSHEQDIMLVLNINEDGYTLIGDLRKSLLSDCPEDTLKIQISQHKTTENCAFLMLMLPFIENGVNVYFINIATNFNSKLLN